MGATKLQEISTSKGISTLNEHLDDNNKHVFVLIFMDGCGPCNATKPEWKKITAENKDENVVIADVNSNVLDESPLKHVGSVSAFPTIKHVHNGKSTDYTGSDRSKASFEKWMADSVSPSKSKSKSQGGGYKSKRLRKKRTMRKKHTMRKKRKQKKRRTKKRRTKKRKY